MLTSVLFQPFAFGAGEGVPNVSTGGVASRWMMTELLAVPPPEVTVQLSVTPAVSVVMSLVSQPLVEMMLAGDSSIAQLTCTSLVYQPLLPAEPATTGVMRGSERSMFTMGVVNVELLPALSVTIT